MSKVKNISLKNYLLFSFIIVCSIIFVIYFYYYYKAYLFSDFNILNGNEYLSVINYNEIDNYLVENKNAIVYVTISNDKSIKNFEKKFYKFINKHSLNDSILYLDISSELKNKKIKKSIKDKYGVNVPYIIIFEDGNIKSRFYIKDNDFNINLVKDYFIKEGVIND